RPAAARGRPGGTWHHRRPARAAAGPGRRRARSPPRAPARVRRRRPGAAPAEAGQWLRAGLATALRRDVRPGRRRAAGQCGRCRAARRAWPGRRPGPFGCRIPGRGIARCGRPCRAGRLQRRCRCGARRRRAPGRAHRPPARARGGAVRAALRAWRIARVVLRYRLDSLLDGTPAERWLRLGKPFVPRAAAAIAAQSRGARLRLALQELGPIFVKFGQILSTRRDLLPADIATELALLQDQVAPFDGDLAQAIVEQALGQPVLVAFAAFDTRPLASASIAQVHAARLHDGREVVVKVLRPDIEKQIDADIALLRSLAAVVDRAHPRAERIRPQAVVAEIETTLAAELDLQREGANASV